MEHKMDSKRSAGVLLAICLVCMIAVSVSADTLVLKDGRVVQGQYTSGNSTSIKFSSGGVSVTYALEDISTLAFQRTRPAPVSTPSVTMQIPATSGPVTVNAGTRLMIRTDTDIVTGKSKEGDRFTAKLESDMVVNGAVVAPRGSTVYGRVAKSKKARRIAGKAKLILELTDLMINNQLYPIVTDQLGYEGESSGTLKKLALGAATGGVIDGSSGAKTGLAVGAGVAVITKGKQIQISASSILEFRMVQPLTVQLN